MSQMLPGHLQRQLIQQLHDLEDLSTQLIRRIADELGPGIRDDLQFVFARRDIFLNAVYDLIHREDAEGNEYTESLRVIRRKFDEIVLRQAELERELRDERRRAAEAADRAEVEQANRDAEAEARRRAADRMDGELKIEIARLDQASHGPAGG